MVREKNQDDIIYVYIENNHISRVIYQGPVSYFRNNSVQITTVEG